MTLSLILCEKLYKKILLETDGARREVREEERREDEREVRKRDMREEVDAHSALTLGELMYPLPIPHPSRRPPKVI